MPEPAPKTLDVHCPHCKQVIVPADKMRLLWNFNQEIRNADDMLVPDMGPAVILSAKFMCKNCGKFVWFDLGEQKLDRVLRSIVHA